MANMYADIVLVCIALYICFVVVYFEVLRRRRLPSRSWKQIIASTLILLNGFVAFCGLLFSLDVPLDKLDGWSQFVQSSSWYPKAWLLDLSLFMLYGSALMCSVCMVLCDRQPT
ncbi:MAG: hypothetical protein LBK70_01845 [Clostridiales bacterium]|nr:hypothetical protein [Clostridiales bacterium]